MIRFLFEAGLPYLALRTAVRSNNSATIDEFYIYMIDMFRATNKFLYAKLCVHSLHMQRILIPELRDLWQLYRTCSLRGHIGRNVGWDFAMERFNLEVSKLIGSNISPPRIQEAIRQLNGIRHVRERAFEAFGIGDDSEVNESSGVLEVDAPSVCHHLKIALGLDGDDDASKLTATKSYRFRSEDSVAPWTRLAAVVAKESTSDYIDRMLRCAPRNNMT